MAGSTGPAATVAVANGATPRHRRRRGGPNTWTADAKARRLPTFVIQATGGLKTKREIVAKFGPLARFEKGKALPPMLTAKQRQGLAAQAAAVQ